MLALRALLGLSAALSVPRLGWGLPSVLCAPPALALCQGEVRCLLKPPLSPAAVRPRARGGGISLPQLCQAWPSLAKKPPWQRQGLAEQGPVQRRPGPASSPHALVTAGGGVNAAATLVPTLCSLSPAAEAQALGTPSVTVPASLRRPPWSP